MKTLMPFLVGVIALSFMSCSNEITSTTTANEAQVAFMKGEKIASSTNYTLIMNGKKHHPFLFPDELEIVKDNSVSPESKAQLVQQTVQSHIETKGVSDEDQLDMQKLVLHLYGDYSTMDRKLENFTPEQNDYFLNVLISYKAIDFKYLAKISKHLQSEENYVLPKSKEYLEKYEMIIVEKELDTTSGYGAHCKNIMDSCTKAIHILQAS